MANVALGGRTGVLALLLCASSLYGATPRTFCNPLNLDYGLRVKGTSAVHRHGADPVILLFNDRYYLFSTWDKPGYRVSDDLLNWKYIRFADVGDLATRTYTAAAVIVLDGWMVFTDLGNQEHPASIWRTRDPDAGVWEKVRELPFYRDPCLFIDPPTGKLFMYHGLDNPIRGVELDRSTFKEIDGTDTQLMPELDKKQRIADGWEICTWDNSEKSRPMRGNKTFFPCREGSWMTFLNGTYYLQFASPGTTVPGYSDGLLTGSAPLGPFTPSPFSPISRKDCGFVTSAGHGCLFQDRYGNWWRAVTMLIGVNERMERRIGLFPAGFSSDGVPYTRTELGDTPITLADGPRDHGGDDVYAGWWVLSRGAKVTTSSSLDTAHYGPELAADEDVRSWWSAKTGNAGEWLQLDLGEAQPVRAVQLNLAEQDCQMTSASSTPDVHRFVLNASEDGKAWKRVIDRADGDVASPHTYAAFDPPLAARYFKVENVYAPANGKFAVSDLRVFGVAAGDPPPAVKGLTAKRDAKDRRKVTLSWKPSKGATSYLIRYGAAPTKLYQHRLVQGGEVASATLFCLNNDPAYTFAIDALNSSGRTVGETRATAP